MSDTIITEVRQRVTRIESRLCRLADALGVSVGTPDKQLRITQETDGYVRIETQQMDVTLSEISFFLTKQGKQGKIALVSYKGRTVATTYPDTYVGEDHGPYDSVFHPA